LLPADESPAPTEIDAPPCDLVRVDAAAAAPSAANSAPPTASSPGPDQASATPPAATHHMPPGARRCFHLRTGDVVAATSSGRAGYSVMGLKGCKTEEASVPRKRDERRRKRDEVRLETRLRLHRRWGLSTTFLLIGRQCFFCSGMFRIERVGGRWTAAGSPHGSSRHAHRRYAEHTFVHQAKPMRCPLTKQAERSR
jgi:non-ribosomal peptide synthetase component F